MGSGRFVVGDYHVSEALAVGDAAAGVAELASQARDVGVDHAFVGSHAVGPYFLEYLYARGVGVGVAEQQLEDGKFGV